MPAGQIMTPAVFFLLTTNSVAPFLAPWQPRKGKMPAGQNLTPAVFFILTANSVAPIFAMAAS
jgi:hypothetical protein